MKKQTHTNFLFRSSLALALAIWTPVQSQSAEPAEGKKKMMEDKKMMNQTDGRMDVDLASDRPSGSSPAGRRYHQPVEKEIVQRLVLRRSELLTKKENLC